MKSIVKFGGGGVDRSTIAANLSFAYSQEGLRVRLGGLIVNLRDNSASLEPMERFAKILNTNIIAVIPRDSLIAKSEVEYMTVIEYAPESEIAGMFWLKENAEGFLHLRCQTKSGNWNAFFRRVLHFVCGGV